MHNGEGNFMIVRSFVKPDQMVMQLESLRTYIVLANRSICFEKSRINMRCSLCLSKDSQRGKT